MYKSQDLHSSCVYPVRPAAYYCEDLKRMNIYRFDNLHIFNSENQVFSHYEPDLGVKPKTSYTPEQNQNLVRRNQ